MRAGPWALLWITGCATPPVDAPADVADLGLFLFRHFEDPDPEAMNAGWRNLATLLADEDFSLPVSDRSVTMTPLLGDDLGGLTIPSGSDPADQVPVAAWGLSTFPLDAQLQLMTDPNQTCIESSSTVWAGRSFLSDVACFEAGTCDRLDTTTEVRKDNLFAKVWYDQFKNHRSFDVRDENGGRFRVIAGRAWTDRVFPGDSGANSWDQLFHLDVYLEDGDTTLRWFSMWSSVSVTGLGSDLYSSLVVSGLEEALLYGEELMAGRLESCPNDRDAPRPPRE